MRKVHLAEMVGGPRDGDQILVDAKTRRVCFPQLGGERLDYERTGEAGLDKERDVIVYYFE